MRRQRGLSALVLILSLFGCGKEQAETPATAPPPQAAQVGKPASTAASTGKVDLAALDAVTKANKPYTIVLIVKTRNNPFFKPMIEAFEQTAKELGATPEVQAPPQEMDKEKQFALVQTEVGKKVDAICIAPADSKGIVPALKAAQDAGVLVVNLDNRVDADTAKAQSLTLGGYVGADNKEGGKKAGEAMVAALNGKGNVAILEGIRGADNAEARKNGFTEAVQGKLNIAASETAEWDTEKAYQKTQSILAAHPDLLGKYGVRMAVGILNGGVPKGGEILVPLETIKKK